MTAAFDNAGVVKAKHKTSNRNRRNEKQKVVTKDALFKVRVEGK